MYLVRGRVRMGGSIINPPLKFDLNPFHIVHVVSLLFSLFSNQWAHEDLKLTDPILHMYKFESCI